MHSRQKTNSPFQIVRPGNGVFDTTESMAPQSGNDRSSFYSEGKSDYWQVLLTWDKGMDRKTRTKVHEALRKHFRHLTAVRIYHAETASITMIHLVADENLGTGFKRTTFKPSLRSYGTRVLQDQEVPKPWKVSVDSVTMHSKTLPQFFSSNPDISPEGCPCARTYYNDWKKKER